MQVYNNLCHSIGDNLVMEPALSALARRTGHKTLVHVESDLIRPLWENNPNIALVDTRGSYNIDLHDVWNYAVRANSYFSLGLFGVLKIKTDIHDVIHPRVYVDKDPKYEDAVVIVPFSRSCSVHSGLAPNKTAPLEWWDEAILGIDDSIHNIYSLGCDTDPHVPLTIDIRNLSLIDAARVIISAKVLVTVDTWAVHLTGMRKSGTIILNSAMPQGFVNCTDGHAVVVHESSPLNWNAAVVSNLININYGIK